MSGFIGLHVGAGHHSESLRRDYQKLCSTACLEGVSVLQSGGSSIEAVTVVTTVLENSPLTNAGFGSNLNWNGRVECDASVMNGGTLQFGAVGAAPGLQNPVVVARHMCDKQAGTGLALGRVPPCLLVGRGARDWAKQAGLTSVLSQNLVSEKSFKLYRHYKRKLERFQTQTDQVLSPLDTVGAVCVDKQGHVAAASSSGGVALKHPGRVGQAAVYACGCWAQNGDEKNPAVASSTSGCGEYLIRTCLARESALHVQKSPCSVLGLHQVMKERFIASPFLAGVDEKLGGVILLKCSPHEKMGEFLWSHTTNTMCVGYMGTSDKKPQSHLSTLPPNGRQGHTIVVEGVSFRSIKSELCEAT